MRVRQSANRLYERESANFLVRQADFHINVQRLGGHLVEQGTTELLNRRAITNGGFAKLALAVTAGKVKNRRNALALGLCSALSGDIDIFHFRLLNKNYRVSSRSRCGRFQRTPDANAGICRN